MSGRFHFGTNHVVLYGSGIMNYDNEMYSGLLEEIKIVWDRSLSEKERVQELRLITLSHGYCTKCQCYHTLDDEEC